MPYSPPWIQGADVLDAIRTGANIGKTLHDEQEADEDTKAQESLERARLNQSASESSASLGLRANEDATAAKENADQSAAARAEQAKKDALDAQALNNQLAIAGLRAQQPKIIQNRQGGIYSINPMTGQMSTLNAPTVTPPRAGETQSDRLQLQNLKGLQEQLAKLATAYSTAFGNKATPEETLRQYRAKIGSLQSQIDAITKSQAPAPAVAPPAAVVPQNTPPAPAPSGFMGTPGPTGLDSGTNYFRPTETGFENGGPNAGGNPLNAPAVSNAPATPVAQFTYDPKTGQFITNAPPTQADTQ